MSCFSPLNRPRSEPSLSMIRMSTRLSGSTPKLRLRRPSSSLRDAPGREFVLVGDAPLGVAVKHRRHARQVDHGHHREVAAHVRAQGIVDLVRLVFGVARGEGDRHHLPAQRAQIERMAMPVGTVQPNELSAKGRAHHQRQHDSQHEAQHLHSSGTEQGVFQRSVCRFPSSLLASPRANSPGARRLSLPGVGRRRRRAGRLSARRRRAVFPVGPGRRRRHPAATGGVARRRPRIRRLHRATSARKEICLRRPNFTPMPN